MTVIALALIATLAVAIATFAGLFRATVRSQARERDLLVNQILHLSGRTWTPPPADEWHAPVDSEPLVREWTTQPEQQPYV